MDPVRDPLLVLPGCLGRALPMRVLVTRVRGGEVRHPELWRGAT